MRSRLLKLAQSAGRFRMHADDAFWLAGAGLVSTGAALVYLPAGLIVAGGLLLVAAVGGAR